MVGERIADRYELEELVGTGGMSSVYRAHDTLLERNVALKILHEQYTTDADFVERFKREARAVAQLSHPNIVTVIDRGEDRGRQYIVFEYIDGENLKERVVRAGRLPVRDALELALQVAHGLSFAHNQGLVHRDVKPQNVLLNGDGQAKVTDFGIARSLEVDSVTLTGTVLGTSNYIAPEQASGRNVDVHTDIYSLGVVLFELLVGDVPFPGENFVAVAMKHVNEPPPDLLEIRRDVPPRVAAAVDRALAKDPAQRFETMDAFAAELEACLASLDAPDDDAGATMVGGRVAPVAAPSGARRSRKRVSRSAIGAIVLGVLALAAVIVGLLALRGHGKKHTPSQPAAAVRLRGVGSYDPFGDREEHSSAAPRATDHNQTTYWDTEHYTSFTKPGVGLVLDAGRAAKPAGITIMTTTPGFTAEVQAGQSAGGPFHPVSATQTINGTTTIRLDLHAPSRYFVVWITRLPAGVSSVQITEVQAS
ncbi:MAG: serine/threonine protein kinase [Actinobacteria bacterium]|nr:MAG: serine/threonine protein kinase [Actinomycetota bacterium]